MAEIRMTVEGLKEIAEALKETPQDMKEAIGAAGKEGAVEITDTTGLRAYPGAGPGNAPPTPYYVRGVGTQYATRNDGRSERYGTQFYVNTDQAYIAEIGNRASYAQYLGGENQARRMGALGWRKLLEVAIEKLPILVRIYQGWIDRALRNRGLT
jgi:hypothetical protein